MSGNGHKGPFNLRALLRREPKVPRGPFSGRDAERALIEDGWRPAAPYSAEERTEYRHPEKGGRVFIDRDWDEFWEDDPIFACLQHDMQIDAEELIRLLRADD